MILVDTNVIAELMKPEPNPAVIDWMNGQLATTLFLSAITIGEITFGIAVLPQGQRRLRLESGFERVVATAFRDRVLAFDDMAARHYGLIMARRRAIGRPLSLPDGQIAAIARDRGLAVATRNTRDFEECGIQILDPFDFETAAR